MNKVVLYCFNNKMHIDYMNGCFNKFIVDEDCLDKKTYYNPKTKKVIDVYEYTCPICKNVSIVPMDQIEILSGEQKLVLK